MAEPCFIDRQDLGWRTTRRTTVDARAAFATLVAVPDQSIREAEKEGKVIQRLREPPY